VTPAVARAHAVAERRFASDIVVLAPIGDGVIRAMCQDSCHPRSSTDAARISALVMTSGGSAVDLSSRLVRLVRLSLFPSRSKGDLWRTCGCVLLDERHPIDRQLSDDGMIDLARRYLASRGLPA
jgi:hypothetical protein